MSRYILHDILFRFFNKYYDTFKWFQIHLNYTIFVLVRWSQIAQQLPGRTDNEIKNYWHSYLKKKVVETNQIKYATSSSESIDSLVSTLKNSSQDPNYAVLENIDKSTPKTHSNHSISHNYNTTNDVCLNSLPKLLFAEWLSLDHVNGGSSINSNDTLVLGNGYDQNSSFQDDVMQIQEGQFCDNYHDSLIQNPANEVYYSQLQMSNQVDENDLVHSMNNDAIYVWGRSLQGAQKRWSNLQDKFYSVSF